LTPFTTLSVRALFSPPQFSSNWWLTRFPSLVSLEYRLAPGVFLFCVPQDSWEGAPSHVFGPLRRPLPIAEAESLPFFFFPLSPLTRHSSPGRTAIWRMTYSRKKSSISALLEVLITSDAVFPRSFHAALRSCLSEGRLILFTLIRRARSVEEPRVLL